MPQREKARLSDGPIPEILSLQDSPDTTASRLDFKRFC